MSDSASNTPARARESAFPQEVHDALMDLTQMQREAVRLYMDRGSPAFGNKSKAVELAGYSPSTNIWDVFERDSVKRVMDLWQRHLSATGGEIVQGFRSVAREAQGELMRQLRMGDDLEVMNPQEIFGDELELKEAIDEGRMKEINRANNVVAKMAKERRKAAELILAYAYGTPEQRVRMATEEKSDVIDEFLDGLSQEDFETLGAYLFEEAQKKKSPPEHDDPDGDSIPEADYELVED